jgi:hypothetical protein
VVDGDNWCPSVGNSNDRPWGDQVAVRGELCWPPMGSFAWPPSVGDCYDNAPMESFWGSMQIELLNRQKWRTKMELGLAMADYIEHFYNCDRRHSSLAYLTPNEFEALDSTTTQPATLS